MRPAWTRRSRRSSRSLSQPASKRPLYLAMSSSCAQRPVRRRMRDIEEERLVALVTGMLPDIGGRLIVDGVGVEEVGIGDGFVLDVLVASGQRVRVKLPAPMMVP